MLQFFTDVVTPLLRLTKFQCISGVWRLRNSNTLLSRANLRHLIINSQTLGDISRKECTETPVEITDFILLVHVLHHVNCKPGTTRRKQ